MDADEKVLQEVAERIITRLEARILPLVEALESFADANDSLFEANEVLMTRVENLELMLGLRDHECSCEECSKQPASN